MKKQQSDADVPRPPCGCGAPATDQVEISVRRLELERDSGVRSQPYWSPSYKSTRVAITALVCQACVAQHIKIDLSVAASVVKAKPAE